MIPLIAALVLSVPDSINPQPYSYGSAGFDRFIAPSKARFGSPTASDFYRWMDKNAGQSVGKLADAMALRLKKSPAKQHPALILKFSSDLHALIKKTIPKFSLERGYEFYYTVTKGERQCFLQSVLISGILQRAGINAGVVMVWRNEKRSESNLGHAVSIVKNEDGTYFLIDASDPHPFMTHQGLFVGVGKSYLFVTPQYQNKTILSFADARGNVDKSWSIHGLSSPFLLSQFDFYRGERAEGGFMGTPRTPAGLAESAKWLERAVKECPENPLAVYVLGHVYRYQNRPDDARRQYQAGYKLYKADGYIPPGPTDAAKF